MELASRELPQREYPARRGIVGVRVVRRGRVHIDSKGGPPEIVTTHQ